MDTAATWGMVAKSNPLPALPAPKDPWSTDWKDEDGLDVWADSMVYDPVEFSVAFWVKAYADGGETASAVLLGQLRGFFDTVRSGHFMTYDSYTGVGFREVRYAGADVDGLSDMSLVARGDWAKTVLTVKFIADDPVTRVALSGGSLSAVEE